MNLSKLMSVHYVNYRDAPGENKTQKIQDTHGPLLRELLKKRKY